VLNLAVAAAAPALVDARPHLDLVHQTGERDLEAVRRTYVDRAITARTEAFLDPMAPEMAAADLVLCRAGATTLAELAAAGRPAVLVPFPAATDDHQRRNATLLARAGAAVVVEERDLASQLAGVVDGLLSDPARLDQMGEAMRRFARPDAARVIVDRIVALSNER
jgi:UDP-N-acetylglucosamine--N-acetylmuramyl-(pentapeptide) pyrophosphoryl-undecaprenol N-acetylglucosamine transferase